MSNRSIEILVLGPTLFLAAAPFHEDDTFKCSLHPETYIVVDLSGQPWIDHLHIEVEGTDCVAQFGAPGVNFTDACGTKTCPMCIANGKFTDKPKGIDVDIVVKNEPLCTPSIDKDIS